LIPRGRARRDLHLRQKTNPPAKGGREVRYVILWLLGIPIPVLIILYLIFH